MDSISSNYTSSKLCFTCKTRPRAPWQAYCRICYRAMRKATYKQNYDQNKQRDYNLRAHFGITLEDYNLMLFQQGGVCSLCGKAEIKINPQTGRAWPLCVDHHHGTGQVRELLCHSCNYMVGMVEKDRGRVKRILKYLRKHDM